MIYYGFNPFNSVHFLFGVVAALFVVCLALCIATVVMKHKEKKARKSLEEALSCRPCGGADR